MSAAPSLPNLPPRAPECGPSPARRRPPGFPTRSRWSARRPTRYREHRRYSSIPARWASTSPDVVAQCVAAGVTKLVALSAINADDDFSRQPSRFRGDRNKEVEQLAVDSGLAWVSLRPTVFATNFAGMWSAQIRAGDVVAGPYAEASSAPIVETRHLGGRGAGAAHR